MTDSRHVGLAAGAALAFALCAGSVAYAPRAARAECNLPNGHNVKGTLAGVPFNHPMLGYTTLRTPTGPLNVNAAHCRFT